MDKVNIQDIMLHEPPMLLVDEVLSYDKNLINTSFKIKEDNIFLTEKKTLLPSALAEIMAQSIAALNAITSKEKAKKGFLVMLKNITFLQEAKLGDTLNCEAEIVDFVAQTYIAKCEIKNQTNILAEGEIRIFTF